MYLRDPAGDRSPIAFAPQYILIMLVLVIPNLVLGLYFTPLVNLAQASVAMFGVR